jgi:hypothetical protein
MKVTMSATCRQMHHGTMKKGETYEISKADLAGIEKFCKVLDPSKQTEQKQPAKDKTRANPA